MISIRLRFALLLGGALALPSLAFGQAAQSPPPAEPEPQPATSPAADRPAGSPAPVTVPTAAQPGVTEETDEYGEEQIVIQGQRLPGSVVGDIPPENTLDSRDVRSTGATNINDLLEAIAPQIGSAQGRGGEPPVLLLNGQRVSSFRELRDIPTEAIQRVEILPEEVALKYGYRPDQKVVNIVLRPRFRSTVALARGSAATEGDYAAGTGDLTRLLIGRNGRTSLNLHAEGNGMLTENERDIVLSRDPPVGVSEEEALAARSLLPSRIDLRGAATFNRTIAGNVSATLNTELERQQGRSLVGLGETLLEPLARNTRSDSAHAGLALNGTRSGWRWTLTGNADFDRDVTSTERDDPNNLHDRARENRAAADLKATAHGNLFKLPGGNASTTLTLGGSAQHLDSRSFDENGSTPASLSRTTGEAAVSVDLPVSRRGRDFSGLGNLTFNANAEVDHLSDFGTLTTIGAGANFSPVERLNFVTSWTREEGAPTIQQLGDPVLKTENSRIFDFVTGETALVTATTGGNRELEADRRNVLKLGANWQPLKNTDLRLRADYVHQTIRRPISNLTVTPQVEAAFPDRFVCATPTGLCDGTGKLVSVDLRPVNFDSSRRDVLRIGFDFSQRLKSRRPSQSVIDQIRAQFGGGRGRTGAAGAQGQNAPPPPPLEGGPPPEGAGPPPEGAGPPPGGGGGFGGGGFFGGRHRGRLTFSLTDSITFVDRVTIAPGIPDLDYLDGDAAGSTGGTPRHNVQAQAGYFNNGIGARIGANWRSATDVNTAIGDRLHFSPVGTFDLRLFVQPGDIPEVVLKHPWLRGTQIRLEANNIFNARPRVHDASGVVPLNYQPDLLDPLGRTIMISFRKLFLPSPATFRRLRELERQSSSPTR